MARPQAVLVRKKVYVRRGICGAADKYLVFQYNPFRDKWSRLSPHSLRCFAMAVVCTTVEVYTSKTSQWYTAEPLPFSCYRMTSIILANAYYLQGGNGANDEPIPTVLYTPLTSFIQKAILPTQHQSSSSTSFWDFLPNTPLLRSAAASLSGSLLTVGGDDSSMDLLSSAVYVFLPFTNSWIGVTDGNLPEPRHKSTAVQLSSNRMIVIGRTDNDKEKTKTVFFGTLTV